MPEAAFRATAVCCEKAAALADVSLGLAASILRILRARSASVKGFWMNDTPGVNMSGEKLATISAHVEYFRLGAK